jgi:protein TonB
MSLTFSLIIHLALVLLIFFVPPAKKESGTPFVTRLVTPDELRREFPSEPSVKGSSKESMRSQERLPVRPTLPRAARPRSRVPVIPSPSPQSGPRAAERGIVPDSSAGGTGDRGLSAQGSQEAFPGAPGSRASTGSEIAGSRRGPAIPAPGPTLREKLFDTEVMGKIAKREEKEHDKGITFDTKEFKYEGYMMRLKERIEGIWKYPPDAVRRGIHGDLEIDFTIKKNGRLADVELRRGSGYPDLDRAAMQALQDGEPYWPLPDEWGKDELTIHGHFVYSIYGTYIR